MPGVATATADTAGEEGVSCALQPSSRQNAYTEREAVTVIVDGAKISARAGPEATTVPSASTRAADRSIVKPPARRAAAGRAASRWTLAGELANRKCRPLASWHPFKEP